MYTSEIKKKKSVYTSLLASTRVPAWELQCSKFDNHWWRNIDTIKAITIRSIFFSWYADSSLRNRIIRGSFRKKMETPNGKKNRRFRCLSPRFLNRERHKSGPTAHGKEKKDISVFFLFKKKIIQLLVAYEVICFSKKLGGSYPLFMKEMHWLILAKKKGENWEYKSKPAIWRFIQKNNK